MYRNSLTALLNKSSTGIEHSSFYASNFVDVAEDILSSLKNLLNTPRLPLSLPPSLPELVPSVIDYGIPNYLDYSLSTPSGQALFCERLEKIISLYEIRLQNVSVTPQNKDDGFENTLFLSLLIQGKINLYTYTESISYNLLLRPGPHTFVIGLERV